MPRKVHLAIRIFFFFILLLGLPQARLSPAHGAPAGRQGQALTLGNGSLIDDPATGHLSLIWDGRRHWITSTLALSEIGYSPSQAVTLDSATVASIPDSNPISLNVVADNLVWPFAPLQASPVTLSLPSPAVRPGQSLPLLGSGFAPGEVMTISGPNNLTVSLQATSKGEFRTDLALPASLPLGKYHVFVAGNQSGLLGVETFFVTAAGPTPATTEQPNPVTAGTNLLVSGSYFAAGEPVEIFLGQGVAATSVGATGSGAFGPTALAVPASLPSGAYSVYAYGTLSHRLSAASVQVAGGAQAATPTATHTPAPLPIATATSAPASQILVTPGVASAGAQVLVSGSGFAPGELVVLRFNGMLLASAVADTAGNFGGAVLTIPDVTPAGTYSLTATGSVSGRSASSSIRVGIALPPPPASLGVSPTSAAAGAPVTIAGTGFRAGETVILSFDGHVIQDVAASASGSLVVSSFFIPQGTAPGLHTVSAVGAASGINARATLEVTAPPAVVVPRVVLTTHTIVRGAALVVSGSGFHSGETLLVRIDGTLVQAVVANASGAFTTKVTPSASYGAHILSVSGASSGLVVAVSFLVVHPVRPGIGLVPNWAYPGGEVRVNGTSFTPGEVVLIYFRGHLVQDVAANSAGRFFGAILQVPADTPAGYAPIKLLGSRSGRTTSAQLHILKRSQPKASVSAKPTSLHRGSSTQISGKNFAAREIVLIQFRGQLLGTVTTDSQGRFSHIKVKIPANSPYGTQSLTLLGTRSGRRALVTLHITPVHVTSITAKPTAVHHQAYLSVSGHGFAAKEIVLIYLHGVIVAAPTSDSHGNVSARFKVPSTLPAGHTTLLAVGARSGYRAQLRILIY
jgi:hypothetical protein